MVDICSKCGDPVEDFNDWDLHTPLCVSCWFEEHRNMDVGD